MHLHLGPVSKHLVVSCAGCPFARQTQHGTAHCHHDDAEHRALVEPLPATSPEWCPLREGPTLVILR